MLVTRTSMLSGITRTMDLPVTQEQLDEVKDPNGRLIQQIFPNLTSDQREFILTGISSDEWDLMMVDE